MLKSELRKEMKAKKRGLGSAALAAMSRETIARLLSHPRVKAARTVMMYYSLADEVDTHEAVDLLLSMGKTVVLPVVTGSSTMELRLYTGKECLRKGAFGIEEPCGEVFTKTEAIDLVVVPGVAFDAHGNRLGRGKGYYDRFLAKLPEACKIGVCFSFQKVEAVPADGNDILMDEVVC